MNKELNRRGIDSDTPKNIGKVLLFLALVILHIWLNRIASPISYVSPIIGGFLFAYAMVGLKDAKKPFSQATDQEGVIARNPFRWIFILMTIGLYAVSFIDRG
jgi:hypothetical protein